YWGGVERRLEEGVLGRADALVAATKPMADDLRRRLPGSRVVHLGNVFDPETPAEEPPVELEPSRFSLIYTGTGGADGKDPRPFLQALGLLLERRDGLADRLEVLFAGSFLAEELEAMRAAPVGAVVRFV